jgi:hypothetical protein
MGSFSENPAYLPGFTELKLDFQIIRSANANPVKGLNKD